MPLSFLKGEEFSFEEMVDYLKAKKIAMFKLPERLEIVKAPLVGESGKIDNKEMIRVITEKLNAQGKVK